MILEAKRHVSSFLSISGEPFAYLFVDKGGLTKFGVPSERFILLLPYMRGLSGKATVFLLPLA